MSAPAALAIGCPRCGARPGQRCQASSGAAAAVHAGRIRLLEHLRGLVALAAISALLRDPDRLRAVLSRHE